MLSSESETATKLVKGALEGMDRDRHLAGLEEWVRWRARLLLCGLALAGYGRVHVIEGYRSVTDCERNYGKGRSPDRLIVDGVPPGYARPDDSKVTWILPKYNLHWLRRAIDVDFTMYQELNEEVIVTVSRTVGMTWGGVWSVRDTYHFEV